MSVTASGLMISNGTINPSIVDEGLVLYYDVNNPRCYQSGSSVVQDLSSANLDGGLVNNPVFNEDPFYFTGFTSNQYVGVTNTGWASQIPVGNTDRTIVSAFRTPNVFTANYYHI